MREAERKKRARMRRMMGPTREPRDQMVVGVDDDLTVEKLIGPREDGN